MVGGGPGANIGETHRRAARFDGRYALLAGAFSTDAERSRDFGASLELAPDRCYRSWEEMVERESARDDGVEVVSVVTPNATHFRIAKAFLEHGVDVICDKPLTTELEDALELVRLVRRTRLVFAVTYNYSGYPMVRQARAMVRGGELGAIRLVQSAPPGSGPATRRASWRRSRMSTATWPTRLSLAGIARRRTRSPARSPPSRTARWG
jgi:predicted dehydrogenase